ncbi:MAG: iron-containing alcohol dehydrogenase [Firmicutes bacterium]|nr:iron-containing alcohol dehydrogenase [Bacillota bacterium]
MASVQIFNLNTRIIFGAESLQELPVEGRALGGKVLVVTGKNAMRQTGKLQQIEILLRGSGFRVYVFEEVEPEPSLDTIRKGLELARSNEVDWVVGLGGGSAMDAAKVIAGLYSADQDVGYYFNGAPIGVPGLPLVTVPTTAGSGAEVTFNAVVSDLQQKVKKSIRDPLLTPRVAIVDPKLTLSLPYNTTVYSGMDALVQAIEAYTSRKASPLTDIYAYSAIERISSNILKVYNDGSNLQARTEMSLGSLMAGIALSNARLGAVHGLAHSIGIRTGKPHGLVCAVLLVPVMRFNMQVCYEKYATIASALGFNPGGGDPIDSAALAIKNIMSLERKLGIPTHISSIGVTEADFPAIVADSLPSGSLKANPREASAEDLMNILRENF